MNATSVTVKSALPDGIVSGTRFAKNQFKTQTGVQAYSDKSCTKKAIIIPANKWLTLKKVYVKKSTGVHSLQFKYGTKTYWVSNEYGDYPDYSSIMDVFLGVNQLQAGGAQVD